MAGAITSLLPTTETGSDEDKRLLISIMFCMLEWCIRLPVDLLLEADKPKNSLIYKAFKVKFKNPNQQIQNKLIYISFSITFGI